MKLSVLVAAVALIVTSEPALAQTTDGQTPSQEMACDGLSGAAFGLCTRYCEALDCDDFSSLGSAGACAEVFNEFVEIAGVAPPCLPFTACPCFSSNSLIGTFGGFFPLTCTVRAKMVSLLACGARGSYASMNVMRCASYLIVPDVRLRRVENLDPEVALACMREVKDACITLSADFEGSCP